MLFLLCINDLPLRKNTNSKPLLHADNTSVLLTDNGLHDLQIKLITVMYSMSKWFTVNKLLLNLDATKVITFD